VGRGARRGGTPGSDRRQLAQALSLAALNGTSAPIPYVYALDQLARRWSIPPWELEAAPAEWLLRGLAFIRTEASVKVSKT
jgi:hypothetical protein